MIWFAITGSALYGQDNWEMSKFIENPGARFEVTTHQTEDELANIANSIQPNARKCLLQENKAILNMAYMVYEPAAIGNRPFGRIRYQLEIEKSKQFLHWTFQNFTFRKIERSPRYAKFRELAGKPKALYLAKAQLNEVQWLTVRWKTELVIKHKLKHYECLDQRE